MNKIIGIPQSEYEYEFMLVRPLEDGNYQWIANYEYYTDEIDKKVQEENLIICHNVRITHKQKKTS